MTRLHGVVFDLDDTLVLERDYVRSGFRAVAAYVAERTGASAAASFELLWSGFESGRRGSAFEELLASVEPAGAAVAVTELVEVYRTHEPRLTMVDQMPALIDWLVGLGLRTAVISDGPLASQRAKAQAVAPVADPIVLTDAWGRDFWKPHERAFEHVEASWGLAGAALVYVGDNPAKDFVAPRARGWHSVRLRLPGQLHAAADAGPAPADVEVTSVAALRATLGDLIGA